MNYPNVSIVVPNWNGGQKVIRCLDSIKKLDYPKLEVIIVDNASTDGSREKIEKRFNKFKLIKNKSNLGCYAALNQGYKSAKNEFILSLDLDVILEKETLREMMKTLLADKHIGMVVPKIYNAKTKKLNGLGFKINFLTGKTEVIGENEEDSGQFDKSQEVDFVPGAVILARKSLCEADEDYFVYYGDADWSEKVRKQGYKIIYCPTAVAWHDCNSAEGFTPFRIKHFIRSKIIFMRKNNSTLKNISFFFLLLFAYTPLRLCLYMINKSPNMIYSYLVGLWEGITAKLK